VPRQVTITRNRPPIGRPDQFTDAERQLKWDTRRGLETEQGKDAIIVFELSDHVGCHPHRDELILIIVQLGVDYGDLVAPA